jgi:hypothetical protein
MYLCTGLPVRVIHTEATKLTDESTSFKCRYLQNDGVILRNTLRINVFSPQLTQQEFTDKISKVLPD